MKALRALSALAVLAAGISGCGQPVRVEDSSAPSGSARVIWRPEGIQSGRNQRGIELDYTVYRGKGSQDLAAGETVYFDNGLIFGPQTLENEARIRHAHLAYHHQFNFSSPFQLETFVGLADTSVRIESQGSAPGTPLLTKSVSGAGVTGGVGPRWNLNDYLAAEARLTATARPERYVYSSIEAALALRLGRYASLRAGYYWMEADVEEIVQIDSGGHVKLRGPSLGVVIGF